MCREVGPTVTLVSQLPSSSGEISQEETPIVSPPRISADPDTWTAQDKTALYREVGTRLAGYPDVDEALEGTIADLVGATTSPETYQPIDALRDGLWDLERRMIVGMFWSDGRSGYGLEISVIYFAADIGFVARIPDDSDDWTLGSPRYELERYDPTKPERLAEVALDALGSGFLANTIDIDAPVAREDVHERYRMYLDGERRPEWEVDGWPGLAHWVSQHSDVEVPPVGTSDDNAAVLDAYLDIALSLTSYAEPPDPPVRSRKVLTIFDKDASDEAIVDQIADLTRSLEDGEALA